MESTSAKIVLIEVGGSHDECLLTQMVGLHQYQSRVFLICSENIEARNPIFKKYCESIIIVEGDSKTKTKLIAGALKSIQPKKVVFNTAQGSIVRNLCLRFLFSSIKFYGILHTTRKLRGSFTQKIISLKIRNYMFLSEFLKNSVPKRKLNTDFFYPIHFDREVVEINEPDEKIVISIIGGVENRRKDLTGALLLLKSAPKNVCLQFLGKSDPKQKEVEAFRKSLKENDLIDRVTMWDAFVPAEEFAQKLGQSHFILPCIHPNTNSADQYFTNQIPGAMLNAFGYNIPLLIHEGYKHWSELEKAAFYYSIEHFEADLKSACRAWTTKCGSIKSNYLPEQQAEKFARFVLD